MPNDDLVELACKAVKKNAVARQITVYFDAEIARAVIDAIRPAIESAAYARGVEDAAKMKRLTFPVLGSGGATVDFQLVADHGKQAQSNHYQSVKQLSKRGGLSWCELYAVLHNKPWQKIDENEAMIACRALEDRYLAAIRALTPDAAPDEAAIRADERAKIVAWLRTGVPVICSAEDQDLIADAIERGEASK